MEIIQASFIATLFKHHGNQLKQAHGYTQDSTSSFIRSHPQPTGRDLDIYLDYSDESHINARINTARCRSESLRCEARDIHTVIPVLVKVQEQTHDLMVVLQHHFIHDRWSEVLAIYYPQDTIKVALQTYFPQALCISAQSLVYHQPYPLAALLAMVSAYTLHHQISSSANHYSPAYAMQMATLLTLPHTEEYLSQREALCYRAIIHSGRYYEQALMAVINLLLEASCGTREIEALIRYLNTLLAQSHNVSAHPQAPADLRAHSDHCDIFQQQRYLLSAAILVIAATLIITAYLGVFLQDRIQQTMISGATAVATIVTETYLWKQSAYRLPSVSTALNELSHVIAAHPRL